jgi:soluble lytic murein transglycosylase
MRLQILIILAFAILSSYGQNLSDSIAEYLTPSDFKQKIIFNSFLNHSRPDSTLTSADRELLYAGKLYAREQWDSAAIIYLKNAGAHPLLEAHIFLRSAQCLINSRQFTKARGVLLSFSSLQKNLHWWQKADRLLILSLIEDPSQKTNALLDSINYRLSLKPDSDYQNFLSFQKAQLLLKLNLVTESLNLYAELLSSSLYKAEAFQILEELIQSGYKSSDLNFLINLGSHYCLINDKNRCRLYLEPLLTKKLSKPQSVLIREKLANINMGNSQWEKAAAHYQFLIDSSEAKESYYLNLVKCLQKLNQTPKAAELSALHLKKYPGSERTAGVYWIRAFELEQKQQWAEAEAEYAKLNLDFAKSSRREWALFRIGFMDYKQKKYQSAIEKFANVIKDPTVLWPRTGAMLLTGDSYLMLGDSANARQWFLNTIADFPLSYYAFRARALLKEHQLVSTTAIPGILAPSTTQPETLEWIRNLDSEKKKGSPGYRTQDIDRIEVLLRFGFFDEAESVFSEIYSSQKSRLDFLFEAGVLFQKYGSLAQSHRLARRFNNIADRKVLDKAPLELLRWIYPAPYRDKIAKHTKGKIDPLFVLALIRQESTFDSDINSPAGARGLMQIMPATGKALALQENLTQFDPNLLYNPYLAIRLGVRYLNDLMLEYKDFRYTLANYNAGPGPARRWQEQQKNLPLDIAAEEISFWETRDYIKKVMGNYETYKLIWR